MVARIQRKDTIALVIALMMGALVVFQQTPNICNSAHASDINPNDFCIAIDVDITNNTGGALTNQPVRFELTSAALIGNSVMKDDAQDVAAGIGSLASEVPILAGDLTTNTSAWWTNLASIANGEEQTVTLWMGNAEADRGQGIYFTGNDSVQIPRDAQLTPADDWLVTVELTNFDDTPRDEIIVDNFTNSGFQGGWALYYDNNTTLDLVVATNGNGSTSAAECRTTWNASWDDERIQVDIRRHQNLFGGVNDMILYVNGASVGGNCNLSTSITTLGVIGDMYIGTHDGGYLTTLGLGDLNDTIVHNVRVYSEWGPDATGPQELEFSMDFSAKDMTENISSVNPYSGTVDDVGVNDADGTYVFNRDQSNIDVVVNSPSLTSLTVGAIVDPSLLDVTGQVLPDGILDPVVKETSSFWYTWFVQPFEGMFPTLDWVGPTVTIYAVGISLALAFGAKTNFQYPVINLTIFGFPAGLYAFNGWTPWVFVIIWILLIISQWLGLTRLLKESF